MTDKELKRLSRAELLELLLIQTRETEKLRGQLSQAAQLLNDRRIAIKKSGDLAEAVLSVNSVMDAANNAAKQYLYNIEAMEKSAKERCRKMIIDAKNEADRIIENARAEAAALRRNPEPIYAKPESVDTKQEPGHIKQNPQPARTRSDSEKSLDELIREAMMLIGK